MLKITYTETGLNLEPLAQSVEEWLALRSLLALRTGQPFVMEHCTATVLLLANLHELPLLEQVADQDSHETIALAVSDAEYIEVSLRGVWIATEVTAPEGIFITQLADRTEQIIVSLWQETHSCKSSLRR